MGAADGRRFGGLTPRTVSLADRGAWKNDWTGLHLAARYGHAESVEVLLKHGRHLLEERNKDGWTALLLAARYDADECVRLLVAAGADLEAHTKNHATPLQLAAREGHHGVVRLLCDNGANLEARNKDAWTPLLLACRYASPALVELLVDAGADLSAVNKDNWNGFHLAARYKGLKSLTYMLKRDPADKPEQTRAAVNAMTSGGYSPVMLAAQEGSYPITRLLCDVPHIDLELKTRDGYTALHWATRKEHIECARALVRGGADPDSIDSEGCTPLMLAAMFERLPSMRLMIDMGADVCAQDLDGQTVLHWAAMLSSMAATRAVMDRLGAPSYVGEARQRLLTMGDVPAIERAGVVKQGMVPVPVVQRLLRIRDRWARTATEVAREKECREVENVLVSIEIWSNECAEVSSA